MCCVFWLGGRMIIVGFGHVIVGNEGSVRVDDVIGAMFELCTTEECGP